MTLPSHIHHRGNKYKKKGSKIGAKEKTHIELKQIKPNKKSYNQKTKKKTKWAPKTHTIVKILLKPHQTSRKLSNIGIEKNVLPCIHFERNKSSDTTEQDGTN